LYINSWMIYPPHSVNTFYSRVMQTNAREEFGYWKRLFHGMLNSNFNTLNNWYRCVVNAEVEFQQVPIHLLLKDSDTRASF